MLRSDHSAFSSGSPFTRLARLAVLVATAALALGCASQIGDKCTVSTDCSTTGDRLCDVTQPGGYCTEFNCEPGSCPDDAKCVNFGTRLSLIEVDAGVPDPACVPSQANSPYKRSFCMASCGSDSDCRSGYYCREPDVFHAVLAEYASGAKVCAVPPQDPPTDTSNEVCVGSDAGPDENMSSAVGGASQGGSSSSGGTSGSSGAAESGAAGDGGSGG